MSDENTLKNAIAIVLGLDNLDIVESGPKGENLPLNELGIDSLSLMELGIALEDEFGVVINPGHFGLRPETTYGDLRRFVLDQISKSK